MNQELPASQNNFSKNSRELSPKIEQSNHNTEYVAQNLKRKRITMENESAKSLVEKIKQLAESYYIGESVATDDQFDSLVRELKAIDPNNPILTQTGWGYEVKRDKIKHPLVNVKGLEKERIQKDDPVKFEYVTPKFDGANVELVYVNGRFDKAISRGNGEYGQDITRHLKWLVPATFSPTNIPAQVYSVLANTTVSISGEFLLPKSSKEKYYKDEMAFRNIPAGFINRKESTEEECKRFAFMPYRINAVKSSNRISKKVLTILSNRYLLQTFLDTLFDTNVPCLCEKDKKDRPSTFAEITAAYDRDYDFYYDGIVVNHSKHIKITEQEQGSTFLYVFKYDEIAYKVNNDFADVVITSIDWNLTRTGKVVPVANFEGVELAGAVVSRAPLHNAYMVEANEIQPGTLVRIIRSGEVIPKIVGINKNGEYKELA